ncbi:MAG: hypothetical protein AB8D78_12030 [Akkermansiaceae bacterium]
MAVLIFGGLLVTHLAADSSDGDVVRYSDFGAVGNGKVDDFDALVKAHRHANRHGLSVEATDGATYYVGGADQTIRVETNTNFGSATFVIDDRKLENIRANVFEVRSKLKPLKLDGISSLKRGQRQLPVKLPKPCVVIVTDSNTKRFMRLGLNLNQGKSQTDVFLVEADGSVDPRTPIIWDFDQLTSIEVLPVEPNTLTIKGGKFITIANQAESVYDYHARGISIRRSRVDVDGLEHRIQGEGKTGAPYSGFIQISKCAHVTVRNTKLTGHKTYRTIGRAGKPVSMGSYDLSANRALYVSLIHCTQTNDVMDSKYWGIIGTNFCKELLYDHCKLSRFDAHMGVTNATIRNSTLGYMGVRLIGSGKFLIENSSVHARHFIHFREDYGSTWRGEMTIRNCRFFPMGSSKSEPSILGGFNSGQHDFGYTCYLPERIVIDGLHIQDQKKSKQRKGPSVFANFNSKMVDNSYVQKFPYMITEQLVVKKVTTESGKPLRLSKNPFMFRNVKVEGLKK